MLLQAVAGSDQPSWYEGRPRKRCRYVLTDKSYDSQILRQYCDRYGMQPVIPLRKMQASTWPASAV
ncbi:hypothetical protein I9H09_22185 [Pseudomonas tremae]|nr:Transposase IS4 protein [Pseudomonas coronafaciens pv. garcae]UQB36197.1 hypothetical protein I9H09_22185 [Pseudomonas tremae]